MCVHRTFRDKWERENRGEKRLLITGIHHFAIIASGETTVDFYRRFGFEEFFRRERPYDTVVLLRGPQGIVLEMFLDPGHPAKGDPEPQGLRHLAFHVAGIEQTAEELELEIGPIMEDWVGARYAYTTDPDGNVVELHE